jgi:hypothetical protein
VNPWGVVMGEGIPEWVADWYGPYTVSAQTDPTGTATGLFRVVRGGGLDSKDQKSKKDEPSSAAIYPAMAPFFARSANRASMAPSYASAHGNIGFRVVQADDPAANPTPVTPLFFQTGVKQIEADFTKGPRASKPFYHEHEIFPNLGGKSMPEVGWKLGLTQGLGINYHNSAVQVLANGDVVAAYYNAPNKEDDPDQTIMVMRRRAGSEEWDMPEPWPFFADAANAAPVFWNDHGKLWLFWGFPRLIGAPPFAYTQSDDNGVTWKPVQFPHFTAPVGRYVSQPINSIVRTPPVKMRMATAASPPCGVRMMREKHGTTQAAAPQAVTPRLCWHRTVTSSASAARIPTSVAACRWPPVVMAAKHGPNRRRTLMCWPAANAPA